MKKKALNKKFFRIIFTAVLLMTLGYILYFGLSKKGWNDENRIMTESRSGLEFVKPSMIFTEKDVFGDGRQRLENYEELLLELNLKPVLPVEREFGFIVHFYDGDSGSRLLIGQWEDALVIMNGDDYGNYRREPKIYLPLEENGVFMEIRIESGAAGTAVFVNDELKRKNESLKLKLPHDLPNTRLIAGSSERGRNNWKGVLGSLRLSADGTEPLLYYDFTSADGRIVSDKTGRGKDILIPDHRVIIQKDFLSWPRVEMFASYHTVTDIILNLAGFIPLGIFLYLSAAVFSGKSGTGLSYKAVTIITICFGLVLSLFIELYQAWLPSRSSSLLDLILNTAGCAAGAVIARRIKQFLPPENYSE